MNVLTTGGRETAGELAVGMIPAVLLFDPAGRERYRQYGLAVRRYQMREVVAQMEHEPLSPMGRGQG